ncbi:BRCT domain-containing protein [Melissococcus plutonius]|uniref:BRCT domain-containing protein n=2 Tax=Melissococcus plutonius TaxID=33970 RepID=A0A2Z5Y4Z0_9ENTE|nr:BRCT domain-containing protein [Melissococcus plutonius]KMT26974.1 DNA ligase LigA [Melissococcus plutonius]KMT29107.1 DNA ligase LigA [Melissococcus plutonius]KMT33557.1 DNA ligase LigA [Melissococcus plutonius]KMT37797.1 DNA ligase LigA [Melissococcus plutonius]MCV2499629.1 BRCT domain-containing protein [Melissococcus plutonius]
MKNEYVVFTGTLLSMTRQQAKALVYSLGGICQSTVTQKTTLLVSGISTIDLLTNDSCSEKRKEVENLIAKGYLISIINEKEFLNLANLKLNKLVNNSY